MTILKKCCCCIPLYYGAVIIGSLSIANSFMSIINILALQDGYVLEYLAIPYNLAMIAVSICLLIATYLEKAKLVIPWLYGHIIGNIIFVTVCFIYYAIGSPIWYIYLGLIVSNLIVGIYFWFCVFAYYEELLSYWNPDTAF